MNIKFALSFILLFGSVASFAFDEKYYQIVSTEMRETTLKHIPSDEGTPHTPNDTLGQVIQVTDKLIALGEKVYKIVEKGRPVNNTTFAPISVLPKVDGKVVDVMSTEQWQTPVKHSYEVIYKNLYGIEVIKFRYTVIYSYGGSYDGKGKYLTDVQIVPEEVSVSWGFQFNASMKLVGLTNKGTKLNPVAAATLSMEHTAKSVLTTHTKIHTVYVTGAGEFKSLIKDN